MSRLPKTTGRMNTKFNGLIPLVPKAPFKKQLPEIHSPAPRMAKCQTLLWGLANTQIDTE